MNFSDLIKTLGSGMTQFGWNDLLDIVIMSFLLYELIVLTKDTRAFEVLKGVGLLFVCSVISQLLSLYTISWFLDSILQSGSTGMQLDTGVPSEFTTMLIAITVLSVVAFRAYANTFINKMIARRKILKLEEGAK